MHMNANGSSSSGHHTNRSDAAANSPDIQPIHQETRRTAIQSPPGFNPASMSFQR